MKTKRKTNLQKRHKKALKKLARTGPFIEGSLTRVWRICGKKGCACGRGQKHPALFFTWKQNQTTKALYVPVGKQKLALVCHENYKKLKSLIRKISNLQKKLLKSG